MTLYVIDDHPLMREAVVMLLRRLRPGANVVELDRLGGMESAVKQHGAPDLICLDLKLPDTTGTSGVHELKKRFPETPLAVLSASPAADAEEALHRGRRRHLHREVLRRPGDRQRPARPAQRRRRASRSCRPPTTSCPSARSS